MVTDEQVREMFKAMEARLDAKIAEFRRRSAERISSLTPEMIRATEARMLADMDARFTKQLDEIRHFVAEQLSLLTVPAQLEHTPATPSTTNVEQELDRLHKPVEDEASEQLNGVSNRVERIANLKEDSVAGSMHGVGKVTSANISAKQIPGSEKPDRGSQLHRESDLGSPHSSHPTSAKTLRAPHIDSSDFNARRAPLSIGSNRNSHRVGTKKSSTRRGPQIGELRRGMTRSWRSWKSRKKKVRKKKAGVYKKRYKGECDRRMEILCDTGDYPATAKTVALRRTRVHDPAGYQSKKKRKKKGKGKKAKKTESPQRRKWRLSGETPDLQPDISGNYSAILATLRTRSI